MLSSLKYVEEQSVLFEGAQGALLDVDQGTYPYVTSSNCSPSGIAAGAGCGPLDVSNILGVVKAYVTREKVVGSDGVANDPSERLMRSIEETANKASVSGAVTEQSVERHGHGGVGGGAPSRNAAPPASSGYGYAARMRFTL